MFVVLNPMPWKRCATLRMVVEVDIFAEQKVFTDHVRFLEVVEEVIH